MVLPGGNFVFTFVLGAPTEVGLARLRQPKVSKSATADFDGRVSKDGRMHRWPLWPSFETHRFAMLLMMRSKGVVAPGAWSPMISRLVTQIPGRVGSPNCVSFAKRAWAALPKRSERLPASTR